jgi:hypothetical protein
MLHLAQNAHYGRRLYAEHPTDGECCTLWFEHISFVAYSGYVARLPCRFNGLQLYPPWNGWRVDEKMQGGVNSGRYPSWMGVDYPDVTSPEALEQKWSTATFVQSAYRAYTAIKEDDGTYRNHALLTTTCAPLGTCENYNDPDTVYASLPADDKALYAEDAGGAYDIVFDVTYRLKNLQTQWFVHKANQIQRGGFGAYEFFTYELESPRQGGGQDSDGMGSSFPSDVEMFALAGFAGRREFLTAFHEWMLANLEAKRTPLEVAEEITQPQDSLLDDIERLKEAHRISDPDGSLPRCADESMPIIDFNAMQHGRRRALHDLWSNEERIRKEADRAREHIHEAMMREQRVVRARSGRGSG